MVLYFEGNASTGDCGSICGSGHCVLSAQRQRQSKLACHLPAVWLVLRAYLWIPRWFVRSHGHARTAATTLRHCSSQALGGACCGYSTPLSLCNHTCAYYYTSRAMILSYIPNCWLDSALLFFWWCAISCIEATKKRIYVNYYVWITVVSERVVGYCIHLSEQKHERLSYKSMPASYWQWNRAGFDLIVAKGFSNYFQSLVYNSTSTSTNEKIFMDVCNLFVFFFSGKTIVWPGTKMFNAGYWLELILKSFPLVPIQSNSRY